MKATDFATACPKLEESQKLDPGSGTLIALGLCYEGAGRTASAWGTFNQVLTDARREKRADREAIASEKLKELEKKLSRLTILVARPAPGTEIKRDGQAIGSAQWGVAMPIDPGAHTIDVSAPGRTSWSHQVNVPGSGHTSEVVVPALVEASVPAPIVSIPREESPPPDAPRRLPAEPPSTGSGERTAGFVTLGGAGALLLVGGVFGVRAIGKWNDAKDACPNNLCPTRAASDLSKSAGSAADLSTAFVLVGLAAGAVGTYLVLDGGDSPKAVALRVGPGSLSLSGTFR